MSKTTTPGVRQGPKPLSFGNHLYDAVCIPPIPEDLSLENLQVQNGEAQNIAFKSRVSSLIEQYSTAERIFATNLSKPSARIISPRRLRHRVRIGSCIWLYNNVTQLAEGTWLKPTDTAAMTNKGCPALAITARSYFFVVHGGRDSLVDRHRIATGVKSRKHESVIHAVVEYLTKLRVHPSEIHIQGLFGLNPQCFDHTFDDPVYGVLNQKMAAELNRDGIEVIKLYKDEKHKLVLSALIRLQAADCGIPLEQVGYSHKLPVNGSYATHSKDPRSNLILITRKAA